MINSNLLEKHILLAKKQEKERILKIIDIFKERANSRYEPFIMLEHLVKYLEELKKEIEK